MPCFVKRGVGRHADVARDSVLLDTSTALLTRCIGCTGKPRPIAVVSAAKDSVLGHEPAG